MFGYHQKLLRVDLTNSRIAVEDLDERIIRKYLGGLGMEAKILYEETGPATDPLSAENVLMAFTGPFSASGVPTSGRHHLAARSPLTGLFGESNVGGSWAVHFKRAGFDGIVIRGKAEDPVYLWISNGKAEIRDARPIWGKDSHESSVWLKNETAKEATAAVIGPAGERQAKIASIPHIGHVVRAAARTGLGAVMGSKNLKAIVVFGDRPIPISKPEEINYPAASGGEYNPKGFKKNLQCPSRSESKGRFSPLPICDIESDRRGSYQSASPFGKAFERLLFLPGME